MDYSIRNAGRSQARFMFDAHSRTAVAGYDAGDYFYAPGKRCYVYELANMPEVEGRGISAGTWTDWPVPEAMNFTPRKDRGHIFVYLPAEWCTVGDEKHKENLFYVSSPVRIGNKTDTLKMGIFMTNAAYVVQPCLNYGLQAVAERWTKEDETTVLDPGEECTFTIDMAAYRGISKNDLAAIYTVYPECILLDRPCLAAGTKQTLKGRVALPGRGAIVVRRDQRTVARKEVGPGIVDLKTLGTLPDGKNDGLRLSFVSDAGERDLGKLEPSAR